MRKRAPYIAIIFMMALQFFALIPTMAAELPGAFWKVNDLYAAAVEQKNDEKILYYAQQELDLLRPLSKTEQIVEILASRLDQMGLAAERLGRHREAAVYLQEYLPYAQQKGWADGVKIAKAKILQYTPVLDLYTTTGEPQKVYGAKGEPKSGVLFGTTSDSSLQGGSLNESMILLYMEFGNNDTRWLEKCLLEAKAHGKAVELALNVPGEGTQIPEVTSKAEYVASILKLINAHPDVQVYLRFGAEMNIWNTLAEPKAYIEAFRFIATLAHEIAPNVAMVWSVNQCSMWNVEMNDYYPGDEYVDWVGVSAYMQKYFLGRNNWAEEERFNEVVFLTGNNADPVKALSEVIAKYADRKPIMLAESGSAHFVRTVGEDTTQWAIDYLHRMYHYIPMVYPEVKLIAYFDKVMPNEVNDYALSSNERLTDAYQALTALPTFIHGTWQNSPEVIYQKCPPVIEVEDNTKPLPIGAYVHLYGIQKPKIDYYIDDQWVGGQNEVPYSQQINLTSFSEGSHSLRVRAEYNKDILLEKNYTLQIHSASPIRIVLNGKPVNTDVAPITENDRTLVPVRVISEALGFVVEWKGSEQKITITNNQKEIVLMVGSLRAMVDQKQIMMDVPPILKKDRTMVPIRFIAENMGCEVSWDAPSRSVLIIKPIT